MPYARNILVVLALSITHVTNCWGQEKDNLKDALQDARGSERIEILHNLVTDVWLNYPDQAMEYGQEALRISRNARDSVQISKSLRLIAGVHYYKGDYESSLSYNQLALGIAQDIKDSVLINNGYNNIGLLYYNLGSYQPALEYLLRALDIKESIGEVYGKATTVNNIGLVFQKVSNYEKAREYFSRAYDIAAETNNDDQKVYSLNNIGNSYLREGNLIEATHHFDEALSLARKIDNINWGAVSLRGMGEIVQKTNNYDSAKWYYLESLKASQSIEDKKGIAESYHLLSKVEYVSGDADKAIEYLDRSQEMAYLLKSRQHLLDNLNLYMDIYQGVGDRDNMIVYQSQYLKLRDSLYQDVINRNLSLVPIKIKEEGDRLKLTEQQAEIQRKNSTNRLFIIILIALTPMVFFLINLLLKNRNANRLLKKNNEELRETQELLVKSEKMASLGVLASGIGHEINNPLNFIKNGVLALRNEMNQRYQGSEKELEQYIDIINEGVSRSTSIVNSLAHFSRTGVDMNEECNIHQVIENCLVILNPKIKDKIEVIKEYTNNPVLVGGNEGKLHQVILNILSNAEQSMNYGGKLTIKTTSEGDEVIISIKDTGIGILEEHLLKISDPFFTTKPPGSGIGLGLFITYSIVEEHGGKIKVTSSPEEGTVFVVSLKAHH